MTFATILIVADEPQIRRVMLTTLVSEGYSVVEAKCGNDALLKLRRRRPDLILLDVNMSGIKGLDACREMRRRNEVPIIMLTEGNTEREKVMALDAGADDYLVKPFGVQELLARIRAALRRAPATENSPSFESNGLKIDFERRTVFVRGERKHLTPKEFELLWLLVKNRGKPLRHRKLLQAIWGPDYGDETEYLRVFISQLRKKIERNPSQPQFILHRSLARISIRTALRCNERRLDENSQRRDKGDSCFVPTSRRPQTSGPTMRSMPTFATYSRTT